MSVSVIVPNYNHLEFLPKRLETIFNQSFQEFEIILLDDCSTDGSWEYLKHFENHPKVSLCIRNESNSGSPFKQWKKGIELAKGDWIWIAESDDFSHLDFLLFSIQRIKQNSNLVFCRSNIVDKLGNPWVFKENSFTIEGYELPAFDFSMSGVDFIKNYLTFRNYILNASSVIFKKPNLFPLKIAKMSFAGDWYFWLYLLRSGNVEFLNLPLNFFRNHENTSRSFVNERSEVRRYLENFSCIQSSRKIIGKNLLSYFQTENYNYLVKDFFKLKYKFGRFRISSIFPRMPYFLYPKYYSLFFISLLPKKFKLYK